MLLTVGSNSSGFSLRYFAKKAAENSPDWAKRAFEQTMEQWAGKFLREGGSRGFPLKPGYEILITGPDEEPDPDLPFAFNVAIDEPGVVQSECLLKTVAGFVKTVEGTVNALAPRLQKRPIGVG